MLTLSSQPAGHSSTLQRIQSNGQKPLRVGPTRGSTTAASKQTIHTLFTRAAGHKQAPAHKSNLLHACTGSTTGLQAGGSRERFKEPSAPAASRLTARPCMQAQHKQQHQEKTFSFLFISKCTRAYRRQGTHTVKKNFSNTCKEPAKRITAAAYCLKLAWGPQGPLLVLPF